jgi:hypothetical protein
MNHLCILVNDAVVVPNAMFGYLCFLIHFCGKIIGLFWAKLYYHYMGMKHYHNGTTMVKNSVFMVN